MSENRKDGGPAFPNPHYSDIHGMCLRDWLAGMALQGIVKRFEFATPEGPAQVAELSYILADAMLKEKEK